MIKRTDWLQIDDIITDDIRNGLLFQIKKIDLDRKGLVVMNVGFKSNNYYMFISDADVTKYYKITNANSEYDMISLKIIE